MKAGYMTAADVQRWTRIYASFDRVDTSAVHLDVASEIHGVTAKTAPASGDEVILESLADGFAKRRSTIAQLEKGMWTGTARQIKATGILGLITEFPLVSGSYLAGHATGLQNKTPTQVAADLLVAQTGTSFPGSPSAGQRFYHSTHGEWFTYSSAYSAWLGDERYLLAGRYYGNSTAFLYYDDSTTAGRIQYSATIGPHKPSPMVVTAMTAWVYTAGTCTFAVTDDGTAVTSAAVTVTSPATRNSATGIVSGVIAATSCLGITVTSGTAKTACIVEAILRRAET